MNAHNKTTSLKDPFVSQSQRVFEALLTTARHCTIHSRRALKLNKGVRVEIWCGVNEEKQPLFVCWITGKKPYKLNKAILERVQQELALTPETHVIYVYQDEKQKIDYRAVEYLAETYTRYELLTYQETQYNILENVWVPRYTLLSKTDAARIPTEDCHFMLDSDPVARLLGLRLWDTLEARVLCSISGEFVKYRRIVHTTQKCKKKRK